MKHYLNIFFLFISVTSFGQTSHRQYAIKVLGIKVGELMASQATENDETTTYSLKSLVDVNFLVYHLKVDYQVKSQFKGTHMFSSEVDVKSNRGNFNTLTSETEDGYTLKSKQPKKTINKTLQTTINHSFSSIHFNEPLGVSQVYAEFYGDFIKIKPLGNHTYSGILDDNKDEYQYENSLLIKAIKKNRITDMVIVFEKSWMEE